MKLFRIILTFLIVLLLWTCQCGKRHIPDFSNDIDYAYKAIVYSQSKNKREIYAYKYYDKYDNLIEWVSFERRIIFVYDSIGYLQEEFWCRMYNCEVGIREIFMKDSFGNTIGVFRTNTYEKQLDLDTVTFKQTKFYDEKYQLTKELIQSGNNVHGEYFEKWKYYFHENNRTIGDVETHNNDTIWKGTYSYDDLGNLLSVISTNNGNVKKSEFEYDKFGNLTKETVERDKHLLAKNVSFCVDNNTITYAYDENKRLLEETKYNHKGDIVNKFVYEYKNE